MSLNWLGKKEAAVVIMVALTLLLLGTFSAAPVEASNTITPSAITFEPGGSIVPLVSPFGMTAGFDPQYQIKELVGVQKLGVRINQTLIIDFVGTVVIDNPALITLNGVAVHLNDPAPYSGSVPFNAAVINNNRLRIKFNPTKENEAAFLTPSTLYTLTIPVGSLRNLGEAITVKFMTADGFKASLLETTVQKINTRILSKYSAHNIAVDVPKIYITSIETIHHHQGLIPGETAPHLSHIDIMADADVASIKLQTARGTRHLDHRIGGKFSATFAGLAGDVLEVTLLAHDEFGKLLERRSFRLGTALLQNDYVAEITATFGRRHSLYNLMADPAILRDILNHISVSQLDRIGIFYPFFPPFDNVK